MTLPTLLYIRTGGGKTPSRMPCSGGAMASRRCFSSTLPFIFIFLTLFSAISCSVLEPNGSAAILLSLPGVARSVTAEDVSSYEVSLLGKEFEATKTARPGDRVEFSELTAGAYTVSVLAFDEDGIQLAAGSLEASVREGETNTVTVQLEWGTVTVTFITNGGSKVEPKTVRVRDTAEELSEPTRAGYTFGGWFTDEKLTESFGAKSEIRKDTTLYAKWTAHTYTIQFGANGGSGKKDAIKAEYGEEITLSADGFTAPVGYKLAGWALDSESETADFAGGGTVKNLSETDGAKITLYALWIEKEAHTITYELNGGTNADVNPATFKESAAVTIASPARTGYEFAGWFTASDFSGTAITGWGAGEMTENVTLYAKWTGGTIGSITVTFNATESDIALTQGESADGAGKTFTVPEEYEVTAWYVDGTNLTELVGAAGVPGFYLGSEGKTLTVSETSLAAGSYDVYVEATKDGTAYAASFQVTKE